MQIPLTKPVVLGAFTKQVKVVVPQLGGAARTKDGKFLRLHRLSGEFTAGEQAAIRVIFDAHDAAAIQQAKQQAQMEVDVLTEQLGGDLAAWDQMTPPEQLAVCRKLLRIVVFHWTGA